MLTSGILRHKVVIMTKVGRMIRMKDLGLLGFHS